MSRLDARAAREQPAAIAGRQFAPAGVENRSATPQLVANYRADRAGFAETRRLSTDPATEMKAELGVSTYSTC